MFAQTNLAVKEPTRVTHFFRGHSQFCADIPGDVVTIMLRLFCAAKPGRARSNACGTFLLRAFSLGLIHLVT